jgi:hypothetical protein
MFSSGHHLYACLSQPIFVVLADHLTPRPPAASLPIGRIGTIESAKRASPSVGDRKPMIPEGVPVKHALKLIPR